MTLVTYFFSVLDLEEASSDQWLALLLPELEAAAVPEEFRRLDEDVRKILDASGNEMYSRPSSWVCHRDWRFSREEYLANGLRFRKLWF